MSKLADYEMFWNDTISQLKTQIGEQTFERWISKGNVSFKNNEIIFSVPSLTIQRFISENYIEKIQNKFQELSGENINLKINIDNNIKPEPKTNAGSNGNPAKNETKPTLSRKKEQWIPLEKDFTFESYVVGDCNNFAVNASLAVAKNPGKYPSYNPLLIYGGVGLGKTHLMQAVGNFVVTNFEYPKIIYTTAENFTNEFTTSIQNKTTTAFKHKYRKADLLLIDDIHFLENKEATQEELFNTFEELRASQKQMVFTCDRPVNQLKSISKRLSTRLQNGIAVDLQMPQYEMRIAILQKKQSESNISIPRDVLDLIANNISTNTRDLVSALNQLVSFSQLVHENITLAIAKEKLKDMLISPKQTNVTIDIIIQTVANHFSISINDIRSKKRNKNIVYPRQLAMYITRTITEFSTTEIAQSFGGKDHSSVIYSCKEVEKRKKVDPAEEGLIEGLIRTIKEQSIK